MKQDLNYKIIARVAYFATTHPLQFGIDASPADYRGEIRRLLNAFNMNPKLTQEILDSWPTCRLYSQL